MKNIFYLLFLIFMCNHSVYAEDTLKIEKQRILSVKSNMAILLLCGFNLQAEYIVSKRIGWWAETAYHREEHSMLNSPLKETNFILGINCYTPFKNPINTKTHNGTYWGPYLKYRQGYYCADTEIDYTALFMGIQGGIQSISKQNIIFNIGMGYGIGYFMKRKELMYSTFFERYHLPLLDFRANVSFGYMF